jgi:2'-phosphotransferase
MSRQSRFLTKILRHKLVELNIPIDQEGYVELFPLLQKFDILRELSLDKIKEIVETDKKYRYALKMVNTVWFIRANQGHSKTVGDCMDPDKAMTRITEPISGVFHATYKKLYDLILQTGLQSMGRKHIHMAKSVDAKSGKRNNCDMFVYIDMCSAMKQGIEFYESQNGVILSEGPIPSKYLRFESN